MTSWPAITPHHTARPAVPPNIQTFQINYQNGAYVIVDIDVNSYYDFQYVPNYPGYTIGDTGGFTAPSWLSACNIYSSTGSLLYVLSDLDGLYMNAHGNPAPFATSGSFPDVAFFTTDQNLYGNMPNNLVVVTYSYDTNVSSVTSSFYSNACFKEGSTILTDQGYRPIEQLKKGDRNETLKHGLVPIHVIGRREMFHPANESRLIDQLYRCSPSAYPELTDDLILTGAHSILVDRYKNDDESTRAIDVNKGMYVTDGKARLPAAADERAVVYETAGTYMIYHLALEHIDYYMNYGIYANGLLVETSSKRYMMELSNMTLLE